MSVQSLELRRKRANVLKQAREVVDRANAESRTDLTADEQTTYDNAMTEHNSLTSAITRDEALEAAEKEGRNAEGNGPIRPEPEEGGNRSEGTSPEQRAAFARYLVEGRHAINADEFRALQADSDTGGGYLVAPQEMSNKLIKFVDNQVLVRQFATVESVTRAESLGAASLDTDISDSDWTSELATGSEDSSMAFGKRELHPHPLAKRIKLSRKLLRLTPDVENLVTGRMAYKFGVTHEKAFMTGSGAQRPLGLFTASAQGISTGRDVSNGNTTTAPTFDGLKRAKYTLKPQYWPNARWMLHRDVALEIALLKDGNGRYLWQDAVREGEPDMLMARPVHMDEYAPNTLTTGQYVAIFGDFSFYWIVDSLQLEIQRLEELYAETNQVGFIGRWESDGMPVLEEAFVRVKLA